MYAGFRVSGQGPPGSQQWQVPAIFAGTGTVCTLLWRIRQGNLLPLRLQHYWAWVAQTAATLLALGGIWTLSNAMSLEGSSRDGVLSAFALFVAQDGIINDPLRVLLPRHGSMLTGAIRGQLGKLCACVPPTLNRNPPKPGNAKILTFDLNHFV